MTYRHTPEMGEISGFGGGYENMCQDMLEAGVEWLLDNKVLSNDLKAHTYTDVFGLFEPDNECAKKLSDAITSVASDCTGAMHHAVMARLFYIAKFGWEKYCEECRP